MLILSSDDRPSKTRRVSGSTRAKTTASGLPNTNTTESIEEVEDTVYDL